MTGEDEVRTAVADHVEVDQLVSRLARLIDAGDRADLLAAFAPGAMVRSTVHRCVTDIQTFYDGLVASWSAAGVGAMHHYFPNRVIDVRGDEAFVRLDAVGAAQLSTGQGERLLLGGGWYELDLLRSPGGWLIAELREDMTWTAVAEAVEPAALIRIGEAARG